MATKYLRQTTTGRIYVHSDIIAERPDMEAYAGPVEKVKVAVPAAAAEKADATDEMTDEERTEKIAAAVASIPVDQYTKAIGNKPPMPKVADVSAAAGFKVSADEIARAMEIK